MQYNNVMPIYEYRCLDCNTFFEQILLGGKSEADCPNCSGSQAERIFSSFAVGGGSIEAAAREVGPCACGAPQRGMCHDIEN